MNYGIGNVKAKIGGGSGKQLYLHTINWFYNNGNYKLSLQIQIINDDNTEFNYSKLQDFLFNNNFKTSNDRLYPAVGFYSIDGNTTQNECVGIANVGDTDVNNIAFYYASGTYVYNYYAINGENVTIFYDTVIAI